MHENSIKSIKGINKDGTKMKRAEAIMDVFYSGLDLTDREVLQMLKPGSDNLNYVRPRITELIDKKILVEVGNKQYQGRPNRITRLADRSIQQDLLGGT